MAGFYIDESGAYHGFLYSEGKFTTIDAPGAPTDPGDGTYVGGINNLGELSGEAVENNESTFASFVDRFGHFSPIVDPAAPNTTLAGGVSDTGTVVGAYIDSNNDYHGFIDERGSFTTLADPSSDLAMGGTAVNSCNDLGVLVGYYYDSAGNEHGMEIVTKP